MVGSQTSVEVDVDGAPYTLLRVQKRLVDRMGARWSSRPRTLPDDSFTRGMPEATTNVKPRVSG